MIIFTHIFQVDIQVPTQFSACSLEEKNNVRNYFLKFVKYKRAGSTHEVAGPGANYNCGAFLYMC